MNFYANHNYGRLPCKIGRKSGRSASVKNTGRPPTQKNSGSRVSGYELKEDHVLDMRVKALVEKYKNDPKKLDDLRNKIGAFLINVTVVRDLGSKSQEKKLRKEFTNYLNTL